MLNITHALLVWLALAALSQQKLYQVVSLSRHGARYHVNSVGGGAETKPFWGELTAVGMRQHQRLGQIFRKEYIEDLQFLSPTYNPFEIEIYSTPVNRTIESIQSQLFGMYPPGTGPRLGWAERKWHLPPYSNSSNIGENNFALPYGAQPTWARQNQKIMVSDCPKYDEYEQSNWEIIKDVVDEMIMTYQPFIKRMEAMFNYSMPEHPLYGMLRIFDVANVDRHLGRPLPAGFTDDDYANLRHLANWYYLATEVNNNTLMINSEKFSRIYSVFEMRQRFPETYGLKWTFLSGHDTDIIAMYLGLNISSASCTEELYRKGSTSALECQQGGNDFTTNIIFQLHSSDASHFIVKVRVNGNYVRLCGKNSYECDYTVFKLYTKWNLASNMEELCGKKIETPLRVIDS